jgi:hypothetical protein
MDKQVKGALHMKDTRCRFLEHLRIAVCLVAPIALQGCASTAHVNGRSLAEVRQASVIHVVHYKEGGMSIMTPGSIVGAGLVADATSSTSVPSDAGVLEHKFGLPDASEEVTHRLVEKLKAQGGYNNLAVEPDMATGPVPDDLSVYSRKYPNSYVLEVGMPLRSLSYGPLAWKTYYFTQWAQARLIRTSDSAILWSGKGGGLGPKLDVADIRMNSDGVKFTQLFHATLEECSRQLADQFVAKE